MRISASINNAGARHTVQVRIGDAALPPQIAAKAGGKGSAVNGGEFPGIGLPARDVHYRDRVPSPAGDDTIAGLLRRTDAVAEAHRTLRVGVASTRIDWDTALA